MVAGTGFGKSLIYQFPPVFLSKVAVVICPMLSLMEDQVMALRRKKIRACVLGSSLELNVKLEQQQIIYLTPEYLKRDGGEGERQMKKILHKVCVVAIDECHCASQWGSDFRQGFRTLWRLRSLFQKVPIVCLTATATEFCIKDICDTLKLKDPLILRSNMNRPNIDYAVLQRGNSFIEDVRCHVSDVVGSIIIYVLRKLETENYAEALVREGFYCRPYHSGMTEKERHNVLKDFTEGKLRIVIATLALGMGIDRSDVRTVIHYGCPKNLESFYQESGRAGRDGRPSKSTLFWEPRDFDFHRYCLEKSNPSKSEEFIIHRRRLITNMEDFVRSSDCRRMKILRHFNAEQNQLPKHEKCCDTCRTELYNRVPLHKVFADVDKGRVDISTDARILLNLVKAYRGKCDERGVVSFLQGELPLLRNHDHPLQWFALGKSKSVGWWAKLVTIMMRKNFIRKNIEVQRIPQENAEDEDLEIILRRDFLKLTRKGLNALRRRSTKITLVPSSDIYRYLKKTDREYFIVDGKVKSSCRKILKDSLNISTSKNEIVDGDLFSFGNADVLRRKPPKRGYETVENEPGCSSWLKSEPQDDQNATQTLEILEKDDDDDEHLENIRWNYDATRKLKLEVEDIDEVLQFFEASIRNLAHTDSIGTRKRFAETVDDENLVPSKITRKSRE